MYARATTKNGRGQQSGADELSGEGIWLLQRPSIASFKYIRKMYDTVNNQSTLTDQNPFCLAFEWMDTTLAEKPPETQMQSPVLVAGILKVILESIGELENNTSFIQVCYSRWGACVIDKT